MPEVSSTSSGPRRGAGITAASILFFLTGFATLIANLYTVPFIMENRELPVLSGIRMYGDGFIEGLGLDAMIASLLLLTVVNGLEVVAGYWLWRSLRRGGKLAIVLLPIGMVFSIGFAEPTGLVIGPLRVALIALGWKTLR